MSKRLGIELEFTGVSRKQVIIALENLFDTQAVGFTCEKNGDLRVAHKIKDTDNNVWMLVRDSSIIPEVYTYTTEKYETPVRSGTEFLDTRCNDDYKLELVSPVLTSQTLPKLFDIICVLKGLGAIVNESCGFHVHIDAPADVNDILSLYRKFCIEQNSIYEYFDVNKNRLSKYCVPYLYVDEIPEIYDTNDFLDWLWKTQRDRLVDEYARLPHTRSLRYHALNFYSLMEHNTIEFRLFNATLDKVKIAEIIDWVLHFVYTYKNCSGYVKYLSSILSYEM